MFAAYLASVFETHDEGQDIADVPQPLALASFTYQAHMDVSPARQYFVVLIGKCFGITDNV